MHQHICTSSSAVLRLEIALPADALYSLFSSNITHCTRRWQQNHCCRCCCRCRCCCCRRSCCCSCRCCCCCCCCCCCWQPAHPKGATISKLGCAKTRVLAHRSLVKNWSWLSHRFSQCAPGLCTFGYLQGPSSLLRFRFLLARRVRLGLDVGCVFVFQYLLRVGGWGTGRWMEGGMGRWVITSMEMQILCVVFVFLLLCGVGVGGMTYMAMRIMYVVFFLLLLFRGGGNKDDAADGDDDR